MAAMIVDGNVRLLGETEICGTAGAVVPERETAADVALLLIFRVPVKVPAEVGAQCRSTSQAVPGARLAVQVLVWEKLASPDTEILLMTSGPKPMLDRAMVPPVVWPGEIDRKVMEFAESVSTGSVGTGTEPVTASENTPMGSA